MHPALAFVIGWLQHASRTDTLLLGAFGLGLATAAVLMELRMRLAGPAEALKEESRGSGSVTPPECTCAYLHQDSRGQLVPVLSRAWCRVHRGRP